jgi:hypothetical protein
MTFKILLSQHYHNYLKVFVSGDKVVQFDPKGPEDQEAADQETDYVNHVVMEKNEGFKVFYVWFKDALLSKNGYVKVYSEEEEEEEEYEYKGSNRRPASNVGFR